MSSLQPVRGTHDLLPDQFRRHRHVIDVAAEVAGRYGYSEMAPPVFEFTEVFARTLGETSDVVTKEMYTFSDRGGDSITLRPEFTAGIARAFMSNGLQHEAPLKYLCQGPLFRYERPQKGRMRQFHQIDIEVIGVPSPQADIEVIAVGVHILDALDVSGDVVLNLNTLGDTESRHGYRDKLVEYLSRYRSDLSEDSQDRLERNPLRIFDSKDETDQKIVADAPVLADHLNDESRRFFGEVLEGLELIGIKSEINPRLVRGLDYYCHTAFEFITETLGSQGTVIGGGRYDGLMEFMGGKPTPAVGWAAGIERLAMMVGEQEPTTKPIVVVPVGGENERPARQLAERLRRAGLAIDVGFSGNVKKRLNRANKAGSPAVILLGEDEIAKDVATVRDMVTGEQSEVPLTSLEEHLARYL